VAAHDSSAAKYVAIITDGNGRWAQVRGLAGDRGAPGGRRRGQGAAARRGRAGDRGADRVSFSTENWSRSAEEVSGLMAMFGERILGETPELDQEGVRMRFIGRREAVDDGLIERMEWAERKTAENSRITLFIAFNYGGAGGDRRRGAKLPGRLRGRVPKPPLRARHARSRPLDQNQRRAADLQLSALAVRLL